MKTTIKQRLIAFRHWLATKRAGLRAGLVAALAMTLLFLLLRSLFGISTPSELIENRSAPFLPLPVFFALLGLAGGFNNLKAFGVISTILGQLTVGALGGAIYEQLVTQESERVSGVRGLILGVRGGLLVSGMIVGAWLASLLLFWPLLTTNFDGRSASSARVGSIGGLLLAYASYGLILPFAFAFLTHRAAQTNPADPPLTNGRRRFMLNGVGTIVALGSGALLWRLFRQATFDYDGMQYLGSDLQPITPNDRFYAVTKNAVDPQVSIAHWQLAIDGMVAHPHTYDLAEVLTLPQVQQETTLMCISNEVAGGLLSNAVWQGVPLATLLAAADPQPGVIDVVLHAADGYTDTIPLEKALAPTTMLVYAMNGEPLPDRHGYPARLIVPGMYGEKSVKWITRIELSPRDVQGFYEFEGWGPNFTIRPRARIDQPAGETITSAASVPIKGIAFGGDRGIAQVEVSLDDGQSWQLATLDYVSSATAWVFWSYAWHAPAVGTYTIVARAIDSDGTVQTSAVHGTAPEGATGYHRITVQVSV